MATRTLVPRVWLGLVGLAGSAHAHNLLVVVADDLGVDRVGVYAEHPDPGTTPNIDRLARSGVLFRNVWANPSCSPTRATMMTGRYAFRTGIGRIISQNTNNLGLRVSETTLPELLGPRYANAALGKWHLGSSGQGPAHPLASGFDHHAGSLFNHGDYYEWAKAVDGQIETSTVYATTDTTEDALAAVASLPEPWFLWVAYNAPHAPFHAPPPRLHTRDLSGDPEATPVEHFKAAVEAMDTELGRLLAAVDLSTTTVFFVGDNGTIVEATDAPFLPHHAKGTVYEGGVKVPFIVAGAAVTAKGSECSALVNTTDLFATLADLAGVPAAAEDSVSLVPYLSDPGRAPLRKWIFAERFRPNGSGPYQFRERAIRGPRYKYVRRWGALEERFAPDELYDLQADPFERNDLLRGRLSSAQDAELTRLRRIMLELSGRDDGDGSDL